MEWHQAFWRVLVLMRKWWREDLLKKTQTRSQRPCLSPWRASSSVAQKKEAETHEISLALLLSVHSHTLHLPPVTHHSWHTGPVHSVPSFSNIKREEFNLIIFSKYLLPQDKVFQCLSVQWSLSAHIPTVKSCPCDSADLEKTLNTKNVISVSVILLRRFISSFKFIF